MHFYSTYNANLACDLRTAVLQGLAPDGGLFMPSSFGSLEESVLKKIPSLTFQELSFEMGKTLFADSLPHSILKKVIDEAITFDAPLVPLAHTADTAACELFHGPTLSFKDFGARCMSRLMAHFMEKEEKELSVLVATSGDTGSAVASGFLNVSGIRVYILYPSAGVSDIQEKQLTTYGGNITALEIKGTFDDCQALVKQAFQDTELKNAKMLASANSINIARLFPQTFYYAWACAQHWRLNTKNLPLVCSVPSGNFGNLTAGLIAKRIGIPITRFIAATNINNSVPRYLNTEVFSPHPSHTTISNAMDVGNPSNFARLMELYPNGAQQMKQDIWGVYFTDNETRDAMKRVYETTGYMLDPHGAVAYLGLEAYRHTHPDSVCGIFLETAHPAKFFQTVQNAIGMPPKIPERLSEVAAKEKKSFTLSNQFEDLKNFLLA
ncbi:threonine synthase [Candidatus Uhrbacteria bacterium]|nr:threonine synthase [Candidatus Uhrbacteria bacterium]